MGWKGASIVEQRRDFVLRALEPGANISALCREYQISRKTGYKWLHRFRESGLLGLKDHPRPARGRSFRCSVEVSLDVVFLKRSYPAFGPKKIRRLLQSRWPAEDVPSTSTVSRILKYVGLTKPRRTVRRGKAGPQKRPEVVVEGPNDLWTVDFKGWFRSGNGEKCEPLTVRDEYSRYVLGIDLVEAPSTECVRPVMERLFAQYGLPKAIQSDNGPPFATSQSISRLTKLSAWWVALGIRVVRSRAGKPQDNGGHERFHRDMKAHLQRHPAWDRERQQQECDTFRQSFNWERPHAALGQELPGDVYVRSPRVFTGETPVLVYSDGMEVRKVNNVGAIRFRRYQRSVGKAFAGEYVGVEQFDEKRFRVWYGDVCLGVGDLPWVAPLRPPGRLDEQQALEGEGQQM